MTTYFKATRPDGTDFYTGTIDYAAAVGGRVRAPSAPNRDGYSCCTDGVLHASDVPTETLVGPSWPCRLFEVSGRPVAQEGRKFGFRSLRVVREVDAHMALGPQGREVAALVERAAGLTAGEVRGLAAAWDAAGAAAWAAAGDAAGAAARAAAAGAAAWDAAGAAAGDAAGAAAGDAATALVVRDLIGNHGFTQTHYDTLTHPWRQVIGPIHPDDEPLS